MNTNVQNSAEIIAVVGASGSGKGARIKYDLLAPKPKRLLVWDFMREYADFGQVTESLADVARAIATKENFRLIYRPIAENGGPDEKVLKKKFARFCEIAMQCRDTTVVVEELSFVTTPSWAPGAWRAVNVTGRHRGLRVIGATQRPALVDKTFFGLATLVTCGRLMYENDEKAMAAVLRVETHMLSDMPGLAFIERDQESKETRAGVVPFPAKLVKAAPEFDEKGRPGLRAKLAAAHAWQKKLEQGDPPKAAKP